MDGCKKPEALTLGDFMSRYVDPAVVKSLVEPSFTAWGKGEEIKPMTRAERVIFAIRNKRDEWRARVALWIAPWLEGDD